MRPDRLGKTLLMAALMLAGAPPAPAQTQPAAGSMGAAAAAKYTLSGTVVNSVSGEPIARALVELQGVASRATFTDSYGHFRFEGLPPLGVALAVTKPGYFNDQELGRPGSATVIPLAVQQGPIVLRLTPQASIAGTVTDASGQPLEDIPVSAIFSHIAGGRRQATEATITTDEDGHFRFPRLLPGSYYLQIGPSREDAGLPAPSGGERPQGFAALFYPGAPEASSAAPLAVAAGQQVRADFTLQPVPLFHLAGVVTGNPPGSIVNLRLEGASGEATAFGLQIDQRTGRFRSAMIPGGVYRIVAESGGDYGRLYGELPVNLASDRSGLRLVVAPTVPLPLRVQFISTRSGNDRPTRLAPGLLNLNLRPSDRPLSGVVFSALQADPSDREHAALLNIPPGTYKVAFFPPPPWYVQSITYGNRDLATEDLVVASSGQAGIEVVMRDDSAALEGTLQAEGHPASGTVLVVPAPERGLPREVPASGKFRLEGLPPGEYTVLAFDNVEGLEYASPDALAPYQGAAVRVSLVQGGQASVSLELIRRNP